MVLLNCLIIHMEIEMITKKLTIATLTVLTLMVVGLAACEKKGPAEAAGKKIDNAAEKAGEKIDNAANKAGEKLNEAGDKIKDKTN